MLEPENGGESVRIEKVSCLQNGPTNKCMGMIVEATELSLG